MRLHEALEISGKARISYWTGSGTYIRPTTTGFVDNWDREFIINRYLLDATDWEPFDSRKPKDKKTRSMPVRTIRINDDDFAGLVLQGGMMILQCDGCDWRLCNTFHKCITGGAAIVAIEVDSSTAMVAYSGDERYRIGEKLDLKELFNSND